MGSTLSKRKDKGIRSDARRASRFSARTSSRRDPQSQNESQSQPVIRRIKNVSSFSRRHSIETPSALNEYSNDTQISHGSSVMAAAVYNAIGLTSTDSECQNTQTSSLPRTLSEWSPERQKCEPVIFIPEADRWIGEARPSSLIYSDTEDKEAAGSDVPKFPSERIMMELFLRPDHEITRRKERDRQQRQHYLLKHVWGRNYNVPLKAPSLIIHWCCGTGIWGLELAEEFPEAKVVGIDFKTAPLQNIADTRTNLAFQNAIIYDSHTGLEGYADNVADYVLMRDVWIVNSPIHKWHNVLKQVLRILKPGGWIEIIEQDIRISKPGPSFVILNKYGSIFLENIQARPDILEKIGNILEETGYTSIDSTIVELPLGEWASIPTMRESGYLFKDLSERRFRVFAPWICEYNQLSPTSFAETLSKAMDECETSKTRLSWHCFVGQKPLH
ncbi:S-adenosyl-L-methionine-dependent methyltransferase [Phycomyces nitens]|nr:S-adenosyl-L-methionine-dependent methyltransferase [Phycomyces nitens]